MNKYFSDAFPNSRDPIFCELHTGHYQRHKSKVLGIAWNLECPSIPSPRTDNNDSYSCLLEGHYCTKSSESKSNSTPLGTQAFHLHAITYSHIYLSKHKSFSKTCKSWVVLRAALSTYGEFSAAHEDSRSLPPEASHIFHSMYFLTFILRTMTQY